MAVLLCFFVVDEVGGGPLAVFGGFGAGLDWGVVALPGRSSTSREWPAAATAFVFIPVFGCPHSCLGWALLGAVLPGATRAEGVALLTAHGADLQLRRRRRDPVRAGGPGARQVRVLRIMVHPRRVLGGVPAATADEGARPSSRWTRCSGTRPPKQEKQILGNARAREATPESA